MHNFTLTQVNYAKASNGS